MLVAVVLLDLIQAEGLCPLGARVGRGSRAGRIVAELVAGVLMRVLEMALEVGVAGEGVDGAARDVAGVAALAFTAEESEFMPLYV